MMLRRVSGLNDDAAGSRKGNDGSSWVRSGRSTWVRSFRQRGARLDGRFVTGGTGVSSVQFVMNPRPCARRFVSLSTLRRRCRRHFRLPARCDFPASPSAAPTGRPAYRRPQRRPANTQPQQMTDGQRQPSAPDSYYPGSTGCASCSPMSSMLVHFGIIRGWSHAGDFAVQVFFALSGWLIGGSAARTIARRTPAVLLQSRRANLGTVLPAPLFLVAASLLREPATAKWLEIVFYKATFVYNLFGTRQLADHVKEMPLAGTGSHFWSVNAEEQFYLLAPLLLVVAAPSSDAIRSRGSRLRCAPMHSTSTPASSSACWPRRCTAASPTSICARCRASPSLASSRSNALAVRRPRLPLCSALGGDRDRVAAGDSGHEAPRGYLGRRASYPLYLNHWIGGFTATVLLIPLGLRQSPVHPVLSVAAGDRLRRGALLVDGAPAAGTSPPARIRRCVPRSPRRSPTRWSSSACWSASASLCEDAAQAAFITCRSGRPCDRP